MEDEDQSFSPLAGLVTSNVVEVVTSFPPIQRGTGSAALDVPFMAGSRESFSELLKDSA